MAMFKPCCGFILRWLLLHEVWCVLQSFICGRSTVLYMSSVTWSPKQSDYWFVVTAWVLCTECVISYRLRRCGHGVCYCLCSALVSWLLYDLVALLCYWIYVYSGCQYRLVWICWTWNLYQCLTEVCEWVYETRLIVTVVLSCITVRLIICCSAVFTACFCSLCWQNLMWNVSVFVRCLFIVQITGHIVARDGICNFCSVLLFSLV